MIGYDIICDYDLMICISVHLTNVLESNIVINQALILTKSFLDFLLNGVYKG